MTAQATHVPRRVWRREGLPWLLGGVLVVATLYGLLSDRAYRFDGTLKLESIGQDVLTLVMVPVLVWAGHKSRAGSLPGHLLWLGLLSYVAYTYLVYAFGVPHNAAFLLYVAALGLSGAALIDGIGRIDMGLAARAIGARSHRGVGTFLIVIGLVFAALWLSDIAPTIGGGLPGTIGVGELPYPVYVADLAIALPAVVAIGVALVRGHIAAPILGAVILIKIVTLGLAIWVMAIVLLVNGEQPNWPVAGMFAIMILACTTILARAARALQPVEPGWLRTTLWSRP